MNQRIRLKSIESNGFQILKVIPVKSVNILLKEQLARRFENLDEDDLTTCGATVISRKNS